MASFSIVEHLYVFEQIGFGFLSCPVANPVYAFSLENTKEAFHNSVVIAVAGAAHGAVDAVFGQLITKVIAGKLAFPLCKSARISTLSEATY